MTRIAVIGHVEWVLQARSREPLERGEIVQLYDTFEEPGGGGGVAARSLPALGAETRFITALGDDAAAAAAERVLQQRRLRAARGAPRGPAEPRDDRLRPRWRAHDPHPRAECASGDRGPARLGRAARRSTASSTRATIRVRSSPRAARSVLVATARRLASVWRAACRSTCSRARRRTAGSATSWRSLPYAPAVRLDRGRRGRPLPGRGRHDGSLGGECAAGPGGRHLRRGRRLHGGADARAGRGTGARRGARRGPRAPRAAQLTRRGGGPS